MSLSRKKLKAMDIDDEKIEQIIEDHIETTNALKAEIERYKEIAEKMPELQKKYDELKANADADNSYKEKYEKEHNEFEAYKKDVEAKRAKAQKIDAYKSLLKEAKVADQHLDSILNVTVFDDLELDENGKIKNADKATESIKNKYSSFIVKERTEGAGTETPPAGNGSGNPPSRAAMVAAKHNEMLYGVKGDSK